MELSHLRYVMKLAKCLHFSKAAMELNITQPSLSQMILKIENELGVRLFERKTRSVELTAAGEEFIVYADKLLTDWERLRETMRKRSGTNKGSLRIGTLLNMSKLEVNSKVLAFQNEYPDIHVTINEMVGSLELLKQLEAELFDVVFCIPPPEMQLFNGRIEVCPILEGCVVAIIPDNHRLAGQYELKLSELEGEKLLFPVKAHSLYGVVMAACRNSGFEPKIVATSSRAETAIDMVRKGLGIALLSSLFIETSTCTGVVVIPIAPVIPRNLVLVYSCLAPNLSAVKILRNFIMK